MACPKQKSVETQCNLIDAPLLSFLNNEVPQQPQHLETKANLPFVTMGPENSFTDPDLESEPRRLHHRVSLCNDMM